MSDFWPFQQPELPSEKMGILGTIAQYIKEFVDAVYWVGVGHGIIVGVIGTVALAALIAGIVALIYFDRKRELAIGLFVVILTVFLWWANRIPGPSNRLNIPVPLPKPEPNKPWWKPFKDKQRKETLVPDGIALEAAPQKEQP